MYEDLTDRLRTCGNSLSCNKCKWSPDCDGPSEALREAASAIEKLDAINQRQLLKIAALSKPKWIPVTERLPELYEDVQILFPNNQAIGFYDGCDWCIYTGDALFSVVMEDEVKPTHWAKKLPEPPKEET